MGVVYPAPFGVVGFGLPRVDDAPATITSATISPKIPPRAMYAVYANDRLIEEFTANGAPIEVRPSPLPICALCIAP